MNRSVWHVEDISDARLDDLRRRLEPQLDDRPATPGRRPAARLALAAAATVAVASTATFALVGNSDEAAAAWSPVPTALQVTDNSALARSCLSNVTGGAIGDVGSGQLTAALAERRASSRAVLLQSPDSQAICITTPTDRAGGRTVAQPLNQGEMLSVAGNGGSTQRGDERYLYGRVAPTVAKVIVTLNDGTEVHASVAKGAYLAWWPSGRDVKTVSVTDQAGRQLQQIRP